MPDITMCVNKECPLNFKCHRAQAKASYWQSQSKYAYDVSKLGDISCSNFIQIKGKDE